MLYSVLSPITEVYHLCQKVIIILLHLEIEGLDANSSCDAWKTHFIPVMSVWVQVDTTESVSFCSHRLLL